MPDEARLPLSAYARRQEQFLSGDPKAVARGLGLFSLALGFTEMLIPRTLTRSLGVRGYEGLVRLFGLREIAAGACLLAFDEPEPYIWARVAGDALDMAAVLPALRGRRPATAALALGTLAVVTAIDVLCAADLKTAKR